MDCFCYIKIYVKVLNLCGYFAFSLFIIFILRLEYILVFCSQDFEIAISFCHAWLVLEPRNCIYTSHLLQWKLQVVSLYCHIYVALIQPRFMEFSLSLPHCVASPILCKRLCHCCYRHS